MKPILFESLLDNLFQLEEGVASARKKYVDEEGGDGKITPDEFKRFIEADPSPTKKYVEWMIKMHITQGFRRDEIQREIEHFDNAVKKGLIQKADINQYRGLDDVQQTLEQIEGKQTKSEIRKFEKGKGAEKVYEDENVLIVSPTTHAASCYYGKGTKWCTTDSSSQYFDGYKRDGIKLYYIMDKKENEKFAVAVYPNGSKEVFDEKNHGVRSWFFFSDDSPLKKYGLKEELFAPAPHKSRAEFLIDLFTKTNIKRFYDWDLPSDFEKKTIDAVQKYIGDEFYYATNYTTSFPPSIARYIRTKKKSWIAQGEDNFRFKTILMEWDNIVIWSGNDNTSVEELLVKDPKEFVEKLLGQEN